MNVYEIDIWTSVKHNGKFSHTVTRTVMVHALNEDRAKKKITLEPEKIYDVGSRLVINASAEFIYRLTKTGTVRKKLYYEYSDGRNPRPVSNK